MSFITVELPTPLFDRLAEEATVSGQTPGAFLVELLILRYGLTHLLHHSGANGTSPQSQKSAVQILGEAGMIVPLGERLRRLIVPDVTLEELYELGEQIEGPSLSEILDEHRGPKG